MKVSCTKTSVIFEQPPTGPGSSKIHLSSLTATQRTSDRTSRPYDKYPTRHQKVLVLKYSTEGLLSWRKILNRSLQALDKINP